MKAAVACIVLAAGKSRRFGGDKRQVKNHEGQTLLDLILKNIPSHFTQRILVLHKGDESIAARHEADWEIVYAEFAAEGMGNSIAAATSHVTDCAAVLIALADMPLVSPATFTALAEAARPDRIVVPVFEMQRGNPVVIGRDFLRGLSELKGDSGARQLMQQHPELLVRLDVNDPGILRDIDTPDELRAIPGFWTVQ